MFTVKECVPQESCADGSAKELCARFSAPYTAGDRVFVLREDGARAVGLLGLAHGKVIVRGVYGNIDEGYRDIVIRSLLHVCRCMQPITVRVNEVSAYFAAFGFTEKDGGMEISNTELRFH